MTFHTVSRPVEDVFWIGHNNYYTVPQLFITKLFSTEYSGLRTNRLLTTMAGSVDNQCFIPHNESITLVNGTIYVRVTGTNDPVS